MTIRQRAVGNMLSVLVLIDEIAKLEDKDDFGSMMTKQIFALTLSYCKAAYVQLMQLELAIRHPNWSVAECQPYMMAATKGIVEAYERKKKREGARP